MTRFKTIKMRTTRNYGAGVGAAFRNDKTIHTQSSSIKMHIKLIFEKHKKMLIVFLELVNLEFCPFPTLTYYGVAHTWHTIEHSEE